MDILSTDIISFEISFRPNSKGVVTSADVIGEDSFTCKLTQDSDNPQFWKADITDGWYACNGGGALNADGTLCYEGNYGTINQETQDAVSWATPYVDDDDTDFWCTHVGSETVWSPYECSAIQCPVWRNLDTLDVSKDLSFTTTAADKMIVDIGRAMLYINADDTTGGFNNAAVGPVAAKLEINVYTGALSGLYTGLILSLTAISALTF